MRKSFLLRKGPSLAIALSLAAFGLTACAPAENIDTDRTRAPRAEAQPESGTNSDVPFQFQNGEGSGQSEAPGGTSAKENSAKDDAGANNGSGNAIVKFGDVDYSNVHWDVMCSDDPKDGYISGYEEYDSAREHSHSFMASLENGAADFVMISDGTYDDGTALYWSDYSKGGSAEITFDGKNFTITGEGFDYNDYSYTTLIPFEVSGSCDTVY